MKPLANLIVALAIAFLTIEGCYGPLVMRPGSELLFWQMNWAAEMGYWVGAPVIIAISISPPTGLMQNALVIALAILWAIAVVWVINVLIRNLPAKGSNS